MVGPDHRFASHPRHHDSNCHHNHWLSNAPLASSSKRYNTDHPALDKPARRGTSAGEVDDET
jgi:hypothetical protein